MAAIFFDELKLEMLILWMDTLGQKITKKTG